MNAPWLNGLPWTPYVYRGTGKDTLTAWMDHHPKHNGTPSAIKWHASRSEPACDRCLEGKRARNRVAAARHRRWMYAQLRAASGPEEEAGRMRLAEAAAEIAGTSLPADAYGHYRRAAS